MLRCSNTACRHGVNVVLYSSSHSSVSYDGQSRCFGVTKHRFVRKLFEARHNVVSIWRTSLAVYILLRNRRRCHFEPVTFSVCSVVSNSQGSTLCVADLPTGRTGSGSLRQVSTTTCRHAISRCWRIPRHKESIKECELMSVWTLYDCRVNKLRLSQRKSTQHSIINSGTDKDRRILITPLSSRIRTKMVSLVLCIKR